MNPSARFWAFIRAFGPTVFRGGGVTPFGVQEFDRTGLNVLLLMHIIAGRNGDDIWRPADNVGSLGPGSTTNLQGYALTVNRVRIHSDGSHVTVNRGAGEDWNTLFNTGQALADASWWVQLEGAARLELDSTELDNAGSGFIRYRPIVAERDLIDDIVAGTELLLAITTPMP